MNFKTLRLRLRLLCQTCPCGDRVPLLHTGIRAGPEGGKAPSLNKKAQCGIRQSHLHCAAQKLEALGSNLLPMGGASWLAVHLPQLPAHGCIRNHI